MHDLAPGALVTAIALMVMREVASYLAGARVDAYARDHGGGLAVVAILVGIGFASIAVVACAPPSPVLAERQDLRRSPVARGGAPRGPTPP